MLQPNANKTVNYEIYTGKSNDRFDCPQNMQLVHKKDFVKSVQYYPHKALNTSNEKRRKSKEIEKAVTHNHVNTILGCYTASHFQDDIDRNEIKEIIETIENKHHHDKSQLPDENFLYQHYTDYQQIQEQYHQQQE